MYSLQNKYGLLDRARSSLRPALADICRYIPFSRLRTRYQEIATLLPHVNPSILDDIAESNLLAKASE